MHVCQKNWAIIREVRERKKLINRYKFLKRFLKNESKYIFQKVKNDVNHFSQMWEKKPNEKNFCFQ